jgi:uncharacterized membrane protein YfcA
MSLETLLLLFCVSLVAGVVDAIAGGGGLLTFPTLLLAGLSPVQAIATNKIQALAAVASSAHRYTRSGALQRGTIRQKLIAGTVGAGLGAVAVSVLDSELLAKIAPVILVGIALFFLFSHSRGQDARRPLISESSFALGAALPIGFYDGFFGPGTGSLYATALVILLGRDLTIATGETKLLNAAGSLVAALIFLWGGAIVWSAAIAMSAGGILGGQLGAHLALKWGPSFIRIGLVVVSIALAARLLMNSFN